MTLLALIGLFLLVSILTSGFFYCVINAGRDEPETRVEIEEFEDPWSSFPPKWHPQTERYVGPKGRNRLP